MGIADLPSCLDMVAFVPIMFILNGRICVSIEAGIDDFDMAR
jgi:hypothetical protein